MNQGENFPFSEQSRISSKARLYVILKFSQLIELFDSNISWQLTILLILYINKDIQEKEQMELLFWMGIFQIVNKEDIFGLASS